MNAIPADMNPQWRQWLATQPQETRAALAAAWEASASDPSINQRHLNAAYARRAALIASSAQYGYAP